MRRQLPKGWVTVRLGEIVTARKGKKPGVVRSTPGNGFVPYLDIQAIEKGEISTYAEAASSRLATAEDVLVVWDGARGGWVGLGREGAIGSTIMALQPKVGDRNYLYRWLQSQFQQINTNTRGTGIPHVDPEVFWNLEVPLAPLAEQRRIVAKLERLLGKVDACQQRLVRIPVLLKRFRQAVLAAACSGRLTADWREKRTTDHTDDTDTNSSVKSAKSRVKEPLRHEVDRVENLPESWRWRTVEQIASIGSGQSSKLIIGNCKPQGEIPWFKVSDMNMDGNEKFMLRSQNYLTRRQVEALGMRIYPKGTLIFPKRGGAISTNKKRILTQPSCIDSNTMALTAFGCLPDYLWIWFSTIDLGRLSDGSNVPQINNPDILPLELPVPPLAEQQEIVRRVEALFALADQIEARFQKAKAQVDKLTQALLAKAFRGELVPQDPNDEPAEKLLERIRSERPRIARMTRMKEQKGNP